ncbi:MAG: DNA polymerase III subunit delta [Polaromonas sp.]|nr:DNA polymerase III subunit delta [Polaromonas sp.]
MNLAPAQLTEHLKRGIKSLYTLHGDEPLLVQEFADSLRAHAREQGYTERTVHTVQGAHFDWSEVLASGGSLSLFADKQIVEIRIPSGKPGKDGSVALQQIAERAQGDDSTLTLIILPRLDSMTTKSAWFGALENYGVTARFEPIARSMLPQWISQRLSNQGQRVAAGEEGQRTLQFFSDRVEGNLLAAHQEIQKLGLLYNSAPTLPASRGSLPPEGASFPRGGPSEKSADPVTLSFEQVENAVLNVARYDVFKLSEAVLGGQTVRVARMLDGLQAEGESEVLVHWAISEDIRSLKRVKDAIAAGRPMPMALRENRVWGIKEKLYERVLPSITDTTLANLLTAAHKVDGIVKGLKQPDWPASGWQSLHRLAGMLCDQCMAPARR